MTARIVLAGTASDVGKTTIATGLMAALTARGYTVAAYKVGPDFIDPSYHELATGRPARNLDAYLSGPERIAPLFAHGAAGADVAVIEGVMGLFDGVAGADGQASTAQVAELLDAPVILVVDAGAMARSIAAVVHGYATFDPAVQVAGVIANRVGSDRHAEIVADALAPLGLPLLGTLRRADDLTTPSRHLGLVPVAERDSAARRTVADLGRRVAAAVDLDGVLALAAQAPALRTAAWEPAGPATVLPAGAGGPAAGSPVGVAVAAGPAFSFRYRENLELLEAGGAELCTFDPTVDEALPAGTAALYLGGGFPEEHGDTLTANAPLRAAVAAFAAAGHPVLAECGGLLYLCRSLDGEPMCGVLAADAQLGPRLRLGYREAEAVADSWYTPAGARLRGHEFHYSTVDPQAGQPPAWRLRAADGRSVGSCGFVCGGVHASYLHTHWAAAPQLAWGFLAAAREAAACS